MLALIAGCADAEPDPVRPATYLDASGDAIASGEVATGGTDAAGDTDTTQTTANPLSVPAGGYRVIFLDIGQGDATLVIASSGETLLVDGGNKPNLLIQRLVALGLERLDAVVATHADADHIAGLAKAMARWDVKTVYWNGLKKETQVFKAFFAAASKVQLIAPKRGQILKVGSLNLEVLHPDKSASEGSNHNAASLVLLTGCPGAWVMLTGDAEAQSEKSMLKADVLSDIDVLKVAHHGSKSSTTQAFLDAVTPEHGVISAGMTNAYGHPDDVVIGRLNDGNIKIHHVDSTWSDDSVTLTSTCKGSYEIGPLHAK